MSSAVLSVKREQKTYIHTVYTNYMYLTALKIILHARDTLQGVGNQQSCQRNCKQYVQSYNRQVQANAMPTQ